MRQKILQAIYRIFQNREFKAVKTLCLLLSGVYSIAVTAVTVSV